MPSSWSRRPWRRSAPAGGRRRDRAEPGGPEAVLGSQPSFNRCSASARLPPRPIAHQSGVARQSLLGEGRVADVEAGGDQHVGGADRGWRRSAVDFGGVAQQMCSQVRPRSSRTVEQRRASRRARARGRVGVERLHQLQHAGLGGHAASALLERSRDRGCRRGPPPRSHQRSPGLAAQRRGGWSRRRQREFQVERLDARRRCWPARSSSLAPSRSRRRKPAGACRAAQIGRRRARPRRRTADRPPARSSLEAEHPLRSGRPQRRTSAT